MREIALAAAGPRSLWARLRPLTGADEAALDLDDPAAATSLLARLLVASDDRLDPAGIDALAIADHDRLLAALFDELYGDRVEARSACAACEQGTDITFSLAGLAAAPPDVTAPVTGPHPDGTFTMADGRRFRPPTIGDLAAAARVGGEQGIVAMRAACLVEGDPDADPAALDTAMETAAPTLTRDIAATCPHCGATGPVRFDLARFLVEALARERPFLLRETHLLAATYGWSKAEIMALSRDDRRVLARFCEGERAAAGRRAA